MGKSILKDLFRPWGLQLTFWIRDRSIAIWVSIDSYSLVDHVHDRLEVFLGCLGRKDACDGSWHIFSPFEVGHDLLFPNLA